MSIAKAYAAQDKTSLLAPWQFERRNPGPHDVQIDIHFCGVCHSDLHQVRDEWGGSIYPMVPGHEIVGKVAAVGTAVTKFKVGDTAAVGVMVDSCRTCKNCEKQMEQYCEEGMTGTYNGYERDKKTMTQGGYSSAIVTDERWVYHVSDKLDMAATAPLLCAGITTYSPLRFAGVKKGMKVGIIGLGGLGHMGVKFAVSFGAEVTLISTSPSKQKDAERLGAHHFLLSTDKESMKKFKGYFDVLLDCVSANHDYNNYLNLLDLEGKLMVVGLPSESPEVSPFALITNRRTITGSMIGGTAETQEMLDYCAEHNIVSDVEVIPVQQINEAYERMLKNDVRYRFVLDMKTL
ncbi:MAG TPA: NAD(P)-dependent alcohol dehydrogenase [Chitinophagaceae bacterium]|nr:NAD(P)-dependent alcohol dehydrogenase [Chitinophagaceae bacterium]HPH30431.1 NAD(P)-dependent alcohol dehydrogenase [Chitinophagaceae bacterium]HPN57724.1 NAD(P)-dependent alcohol dehydrogenase [Chitinophagaceae bacterium]